MELSQKAKDVIAQAPQWNLEGDCFLLKWMQEISQHLEQKATTTSKALKELNLNVNCTSIALDNATNNLTALQHKQFVENRCRDDDDIVYIKSSSIAEKKKQTKTSNADILNTFLQNNVQVLHTCHDKYALQFDDFDGGNTENNYIYQQKNPYNERLLPHIYGSKLWKESCNVGLCVEVTNEIAGDTASETYSEASIIQQQSEKNDSNSLHSAGESVNSMEIAANNLQIKNASSLQDSEGGLFSVTQSHANQTPPEIDTYSVEADFFNSMEHIPRPTIPISTHNKPSRINENTANNTAKADTPRNTGSLLHDNNFKAVISDIVDRATNKNIPPLLAVRKLSTPQLPEEPTTATRPEMQTKALPAQSNTKKAVFNLFDSPIHEKKSSSTAIAPTILEQPTSNVEVPKTVNEISKSSKFIAKNLFDDDDDDDDEDFLTAFGNKYVKSVAKIERTNLFENIDGEDIFSSTLAKKSAENATETIDNILFETEPPSLDKLIKEKDLKISQITEKTSQIIEKDFKEEKTKAQEVKLFGDDDDDSSFENLSDKQITDEALLAQNVAKTALFKKVQDISSTSNKGTKKVSLFEDVDSDEDNGLFFDKNSKMTTKTNIIEKKTKLEELINDDLDTDTSVVTTSKEEKQIEAQAININENNFSESIISDNDNCKKKALFEDFDKNENDIFSSFENSTATTKSQATNFDSFYNTEYVTEDFTKQSDFEENNANEVSVTENYENQYLCVAEEIATANKKTKESKVNQYASIFSDEPPEDDDEDFRIIPNSNITTKVASKINEDSQVSDFYESPITLSVASEKAIKPSSHDIDYGALHLFSDIPPDDDFEDIENMKIASKRLKSIFDVDSHLQAADTQNCALKITKSTDVTDKVMPPKPDGFKTISKLQMPEITINVNALLPNSGGIPKMKAALEKQQKVIEKVPSYDIVAEITREDPEEDNTKLSHMCKGRVRGPANRRPSTRSARHANYQQTLLEEAKPELHSKALETTAQQIDSTESFVGSVLPKNLPQPLVESTGILHNENPPPPVTEKKLITKEIGGSSNVNVIKRNEFSNIFQDDDDDDLFFNTSTSTIKPHPHQTKHAKEAYAASNVSEHLAKSMLFVKTDIENLENDNMIEEGTQIPTSQQQQKKKSLFFDEENDDDDLFKSIKPSPSNLVKPTLKQLTETAVTATKMQKVNKDTSLFGSSDEDDEFFNKSNNLHKVSNSKTQKLFNDDFNIGDNNDDDDDLFSSTKTKNKNRNYKPLSTLVSNTTKSFEIKKQSSLSDNPLADLL